MEFSGLERPFETLWEFERSEADFDDYIVKMEVQAISDGSDFEGLKTRNAFLYTYRVDSDEWKVMALSAFDVDYEDFYQKILGTIHLNDDGTFGVL